MRYITDNLSSMLYTRRIMEGTDDNKSTSYRRVIKSFGRITKIKETWDFKDPDFVIPDEVLSKYVNVNSNIEDIDLNKILSFLKRKPKVSIQDIPKILKRVTKHNFTLEMASNLRIIFLCDRGVNNRFEFRYNKRLFKLDSEEDASMVVFKPHSSELLTASTAQVNATRVAMLEARKYEDEDVKNITKQRKTIVREFLTNKVRPIVKESVNLSKIREDSGCTDKEAETVAGLANKAFESFKKLEKDITKDIVSVSVSNGGTMYRLDMRMKQPTSLGRKIATDAKKNKEGFTYAVNNLKDVVRYTVVLDDDEFTEGYFSIKSDLEDLGYREIRCKNFFTMFSNGVSQQKAVQCVYVSPSGIIFEFQFHTPTSISAKEVNHPLYEKFRSKDTPPEEVRVIDFRMVFISDNVPTPAGVMSIKEYDNTEKVL